jgi:predicted proteasome-type protease
MTYCVGISLKGGLVMLSHTRTNAGVDSIATVGKRRVSETHDERVLCLLFAGGLALSRIVVSMVRMPLLQIGEHRHGQPILDRATRHATRLHDAVKPALVSMASTHGKLTVGLPTDLPVYKKDTSRIAVCRRITEDNAYFRNLRELWSPALTYRRIPQPNGRPETPKLRAPLPL